MFANEKHEEAYNLAKLGKLDEAIILFEQAIQLSPNNADIYSDRGVLYIHKKDKIAAISDFNEAVALQADYSFRYSARAYAHDFFGDTEAAVQDYEKAIELDPSDSVAYNNLGLVQEKLGYQAKAKSNFERADKLAKQEAKLHELMHDLERNDEPSNKVKIKDQTEAINEESMPRETLIPVEKKNEKQSAFNEFTKLFTSKEQFNAFLKFLKNGFKIK
jgi:Flp pilus assembly protein TadD